MDDSMFDLAERFKELKDQKRQAEARLKDIQAELDATETKLSERMLDSETQSFNRSGTLFYLTTRTFATPELDQKQALYDALKENGFGSLVTEVVNANSLSAFVKEQITDNDDVLPGWLDGKVKVFEKTSVALRNAK